MELKDENPSEHLERTKGTPVEPDSSQLSAESIKSSRDKKIDRQILPHQHCSFYFDPSKVPSRLCLRFGYMKSQSGQTFQKSMYRVLLDNCFRCIVEAFPAPISSWHRHLVRYYCLISAIYLSPRGSTSYPECPCFFLLKWMCCASYADIHIAGQLQSLAFRLDTNNYSRIETCRKRELEYIPMVHLWLLWCRYR